MRFRPAVLALALLAAPASVGAGCTDHFIFHGDPEKQAPEETDWRDTEPVSAPSADVLWNHVIAVFEDAGLPVDDRATDWSKREIVTQWNASLGTTRYEGRRIRGHARIVDAPGGKWIARIAVVRQRNTDMKDPTDPFRAKWERDEADVNRAALLVWKVNSAYAPKDEGADDVPPAPPR